MIVNSSNNPITKKEITKITENRDNKENNSIPKIGKSRTLKLLNLKNKNKRNKKIILKLNRKKQSLVNILHLFLIKKLPQIKKS